MTEKKTVRQALTLEVIVDTIHSSTCAKFHREGRCFHAADDYEMRAGRALRKLVLEATR